MAKKLRIILPIAAAVLVLLAAVSIFFPDHSPKEPQEVPDAIALYENAASAISSIQELSYRITETHHLSVGGSTLTQQSVRKIQLRRSELGITQYYIDENLSIGTHQVSASEHYSGESLYLTLEDSHFSAAISQQDAEVRLTPALLITSELYTSVRGYSSQGGITIQFSGATGLEPWLSCDGGKLVSAAGTAFLDRDGNLTKSIYDVTYQASGKNFHRIFICENPVSDPASFPALGDPDSYPPISDPDSLKTLELVSGYLLSTDCVGTVYTDRIACEVFGDVREQSIQLQIHADGDWSAQRNTSVTLTNATKAGAATTVLQSETFKKGIYSVSKDNGEATQNPDITEEIMKKHCGDLLVGTIPLPSHISDVTVTQGLDACYLEFTVNTSFANILREEACQILYQNGALFAEYEDSYSTDIARCQLTVDLHTGLPLSSGFEYKGTYHIDSLPYSLEYTAEQVYSYPPA